MVNSNKTRIVVFASGRGSNFKALCEATQKQTSAFQIVALVCNDKKAVALSVADTFNIPTVCIEHSGMTRAEHEKKISDELSKYSFDWIVLAGYMRIFSKAFIEKFWDNNLSAARMINIHPSLLPQFPGTNAYEQAIQAKVTQTGASVHLVSYGVDDGPVLAQQTLEVSKSDTVQTLTARGLKLEHELYCKTLQSFFSDPTSAAPSIFIERAPKNMELDAKAKRVGAELPIFFPRWKNLKNIRALWVEVYWIKSPSLQQTQDALCNEILFDPLYQISKNQKIEPPSANPGMRWWCLPKKFKTGVTDNAGHVLEEALKLILPESSNISCQSGAKLWLELPESISEAEVQTYAKEVFLNELIETQSLEIGLSRAASKEKTPPKVLTFLPEELEKVSESKLWALSKTEIQTIAAHYKTLNRAITDVEIEVLAQTWSEHCKHKIFAANITVENKRTDIDLPQKIQSVFKTYIRGATKELSSQKNYLKSVFEDNAGVISITKEVDCAIKVETHNSPSALDPYGGSLTGIVGVNRDILGVGLGAKPIANLDVFCVGELDTPEPLPPRLHHPRRILEGVRLGVEHGGNKSGIPTVTGAIVHHPDFLGKPLVFCGTVGVLPTDRNVIDKQILAGDKIVMAGGRVGKDGIHGATFSSLEMNEDSPVSAVQLGDPLTQRRVWDFLIEARDQKLFRAVTDNGAGGLSSSIGELARLCGKKGGAKMDVGLAKTKYPGLLPYELVVSESQERMSFAVAPEKIDSFLSLAQRRGVECSVLGEFEDSGKFHILYQGETVANLDMTFLHEGVPTLQLNALVEPSKPFPNSDVKVYGVISQLKKIPQTLEKALPFILGSPNVCSRKPVTSQYDHEVQARSVRKPYGSLNHAAPCDGAALRLGRVTHEGVALGLGLAPFAATQDPKVAAELALDEAIRNAVVSGMDPDHAALVDNFCWPDPLESEHNPDAREKLGALVVTCQRIYEGALALGMPFVSGKDSMKNDYRMGGKKISVPPTLLMTVMGKIHDVRTLPRPNASQETVQTVLWTCGQKNFFSNNGLPEIDFAQSRKFFQKLHHLISQGKIAAAHDVSDGGFLCTTAEMLFGTNTGAILSLDSFLKPFHQQWTYLFSEPATSFVLMIDPAHKSQVIEALSGFQCFEVGLTTPKTPELVVQLSSSPTSSPTSWSTSKLHAAYENREEIHS